jgi:hypothetical protein
MQPEYWILLIAAILTESVVILEESALDQIFVIGDFALCRLDYNS